MIQKENDNLNYVFRNHIYLELLQQELEFKRCKGISLLTIDPSANLNA